MRAEVIGINLSRRRSWRGALSWWTVMACPSVLAQNHPQAPTMPSHATDQWPLWSAFRDRFMREDGRVVSDADKGQTFSEAQAYALFFALIANDRASFDKILQWTQNNLCQGSMEQHLPAWLWGQRADQQWGVLDANAAADADLWLVYTLGEAARLWKEPRYQRLAQALCSHIEDKECVQLPQLGWCVLPGPQGFDLGDQRWRLNPSYWPLQQMTWMARFAPSQRKSLWAQVLENTPLVIAGSAPRGWAADWVVYDGRKGFIPYTPSNSGDMQASPLSSYDAIRVSLWAGLLHRHTPALALVHNSVRGMVRWLQRTTVPPERVHVLTEEASGSGGVGFSAAVLPLLRLQAQQSPSEAINQALQAQWQRVQRALTSTHAYYQSALMLFGIGGYEQVYTFDAQGRVWPRWSVST